MQGFFKDKKKVLLLLCGVLLVLTLGIGIFAALTLRDKPVSGSSSSSSSSDQSSDTGSVDSSKDDSSEGNSTEGDSSDRTNSDGTVTDTEGTGEAQPPEQDYLVPPVADPVYFNRPAAMKAVYIRAGEDYLRDSSGSESTIKAEIDKALQDAKTLDMNSIIMDTKVGNKAAYLNAPFKTVSIQFDPLAYLIEKAKEMGFYTYIIYDSLDIPGEDGAITASEIQGETVDSMKAGLKKIIDNYPVDGVLLDGYYNPDTETSYNDYLKHGGGIGYENYMRDVSQMVFQNLAYTIRHTSPAIQVGMMTEAVWENAAANDQGSQTTAEFTTLGTGNSDNLSYIPKGLVDFVAVKAFGSTTDKAIPFKAVVSWWAENTNDYDVPMYVVHAEDKIASDNPGWTEYDQIIKQLIEAEKIVGFDGSMYNALGRLNDDPKSSTTNLMKYYKKEINPKHVLTELAVTKPAKQTYTTFEQTVTFAGASDPITDVTINGEKIATDTNGYFTINKPLVPGANSFTIVHKGKTVTYNITREVEIIKEMSPTGSLTVDGGMQITISATAYADAQVYAVVGGQTIAMAPVEYEGDDTNKNTSYKRFEGVYTAPDATNAVQNIGNIVVHGSWQGITKSAQGAAVKVNKRPVMGDGKPVHVISDQAETFPTNVINDYSHPDYFPLPKGTIDYTIGDEIIYRDGNRVYSYYNLNSNLRVYTKDIQAISEENGVYQNKISGITVKADGNYTNVILATKQKVSYKASYDGSSFSVTFNYTTTVPTSMKLSKNPLFNSANWNGTTLKLVLKKSGAFLGYKAYYDTAGNLVFRFNNPPGGLSGARIVVDPGHGGSDPGAPGFLPSYPESVINGMMGEKVAAQLKAAGATVLLLNQAPEPTESSAKVELGSRVLQARAFNPHVYLSLHCNSALNSSATGTEAYYFNAYSKNLAAYNSTKISDAMGNTNRGGKFGYYYVTRDSQFASTLIETGFLSNEREYKKLINEEYQTEVAKAVASGTSTFLKSLGASGETGSETNGEVTVGASSSSSNVSSSVPPPNSSSSKPSNSDGTISVEGIEISKETANIAKGATYRLSASVFPSDADNTDVVWSSDDKSVATVSATGLVKGIENGTAVIRVKSVDGDYEAHCTVTVSKSGSSSGSGNSSSSGGSDSGSGSTGISLDESDITIDIDEEYSISATIRPSSADYSIEWTTSNNKVAMVTTDGVVIGVGKGTATITATAKINKVTKKASCSVTVTNQISSGGGSSGGGNGNVEELELDKDMLELAIGGSWQFDTFVYPEDANNTKITWTSSAPKVASVDSNGKVKALSEGPATITAICKVGGARASCQVYVTQDGPSYNEDETLTKLTLNTTQVYLSIDGTSKRITANTVPGNLPPSKLEWTVEDTYGDKVIRTVIKDNTIMIYPQNVGEALITVTYKDDPDFYAECYVVVEE